MATTRVLGHDGLVSSTLGFGCMGLSQGYGATDDDTSLQALLASVDSGVTHLDTAMSYGQGHNERLIGRALAGRREEVTIATKFGIVRGADGVALDGRPHHVAAYCEASLGRLGIDTIDLYYLHRVDPEVPVEDTIGAMGELVRAGKVRHLGISEVGPRDLERAAATHPIAAVQFEWSMFWREPEDDVVPAARRLGIGLVPYSPLGRGMLTGSVSAEVLAAAETGDFRRDDPRFHGPDLERNLDLVARLRRLADGHGATASQLALAWLLTQGDDVVPIPGTRHAHRARDNALAADLDLDPTATAELRAIAERGNWSGNRRSFAAFHLERASAF